jgi:SAM-dependent methyltransferase
MLRPVCAVLVDLNPGMLAVARRKEANVEWQQALAEALPFESESFDAVVSQFGLMFFEDKEAAIGEMWRVLRPGGRLVIAAVLGLVAVSQYVSVGLYAVMVLFVLIATPWVLVKALAFNARNSGGRQPGCARPALHSRRARGPRVRSGLTSAATR